MKNTKEVEAILKDNKPHKLAKLSKKVVRNLESFFEDVKDFFYWNGAILAVGVVIGSAILGGLHHAAYFIRRGVLNERYTTSIEENVEVNNFIKQISFDDFYARKSETGKFYVDVYGTLFTQDGVKPSYGIVSYEIDETLYNKITEHFRLDVEYNSYGQPIDVARDGKVRKALDSDRNDRLQTKLLKEIKEVTLNRNPSRIEVFEGGEKPQSNIILDLENDGAELGN